MSGAPWRLGPLERPGQRLASAPGWCCSRRPGGLAAHPTSTSARPPPAGSTRSGSGSRSWTAALLRAPASPRSRHCYDQRARGRRGGSAIGASSPGTPPPCRLNDVRPGSTAAGVASRIPHLRSRVLVLVDGWRRQSDAIGSGEQPGARRSAREADAQFDASARLLLINVLQVDMKS